MSDAVIYGNEVMKKQIDRDLCFCLSSHWTVYHFGFDWEFGNVCLIHTCADRDVYRYILILIKTLMS